ncbi:methylated-DNA--[protein]-cysteine S-methyltransferase [Roseimaritima ulvae]|nr:methylated-DNA--[protein]-cysteine S-methyltransferase [Roseimaritima ulvae]
MPKLKPAVASAIVLWRPHSSPLGTLYSQWTAAGLAHLGWQRPPLEDLDVATDQVQRQAEHLDECMQRFFADGDGDVFADVTLDTTGWPPFFADVYRACRRIPSGQTISYAALAAAAGRPAAVRAAGQAMARNRVPLIVPCHRVVSRQGLRGFSAPGGLATKQWLLDLEQQGATTAKI